MNPYSAPGVLPIQEILDDILAEVFDIDRSDLYTPTRRREVVEARQLGMYIRSHRMMTDKATLAMVGRAYNRDHTTVIHAQKVVNNLIATDRRFREKARLVLRNYGNYEIYLQNTCKLPK